MADTPKPIALAWSRYATKDSVEERAGVSDDVIEELRHAFFFGATIAIGKALDGNKTSASDEDALAFMEIIDELHAFLHEDDAEDSPTIN